jgi:hypothetical protein
VAIVGWVHIKIQQLNFALIAREDITQTKLDKRHVHLVNLVNSQKRRGWAAVWTVCQANIKMKGRRPRVLFVMQTHLQVIRSKKIVRTVMLGKRQPEEVLRVKHAKQVKPGNRVPNAKQACIVEIQTTPNHVSRANQGISRVSPVNLFVWIVIRANIPKTRGPSYANSVCRGNTTTSKEQQPVNFVPGLIYQTTNKLVVCVPLFVYRTIANEELNF